MSNTTSDTATERYRVRPETVVTDRGDGPAVVFAHGTLMDRTMFDPQVEALADDFRTVAYDLRARTDQYASSYDLYDLADDVDALCDGLDLDTVVLCGMSMGGFMALRFAERYPERLDGLVLIDSMAESYTEVEREQYGQLAEQARAEGKFTEPGVTVARDGLFGETTRAENPALPDRWVERWRTYPAEGFYREMHSWLNQPDFTPKLSGIDVPVLSIHGEEDASIAPERTEPMLDALPNARQELIPEAGHSSNLENPEAVNEALRGFLNDVY
ncbi:alpha/beta fold hydrolase [Halococcus sp. IIIV-5B]|uniref:alpha/beta fold hydrolase n=1 Tax=Halococcus sp. IIIV-5B TaxID=2321230 RepID=UPI000E729EA5|nr:alpha/beta hydrolase [Halococcus sp. IIIV-5B]RJT03386.1 alpha/beta fold hydrolase [Halococcus sp. IIIV-5B]